MEFLSRNKVYTKVSANKDAKKVYLLCEGDKEVNYFKYFQGFSSNIDIIPVYNDNGKSSPLKLLEHAKVLFFGDKEKGILPKFELNLDYRDEVWFVIDTDRWNEGDQIEKLKYFCEAFNGKNNIWFVTQSNPSFELWLFYHHESNKPNREEVAIHGSFKEFVDRKIKGGFDHRRMPIQIEIACENSYKNFISVNNQPDLYSTDLHNLGKVILSFIKEHLDKAKSIVVKGKENAM